MAALVITPEVDREMKRLADSDVESSTREIAVCLQDILRKGRASANPRGIEWARVDAIVDSLRGKVDRSLTEEEILGYGPSGLSGEV